MATPCLLYNVYIGLGSNLGDKRGNLEKALALTAEKAGKILALSGFYETQAWGYDSSETYLNAAAQIATTLPPQELMRVAQEIERELGRAEKTSNGVYRDRPIDVDLLIYEDFVIESPELTIPHPLMHKRLFVLQPLAEIAPALVHPTIGATITELLARLENIQNR